jgi:hypothetical protein
MIERDQTMRRLLFSLLAMSSVGMFAGCEAIHGVIGATHGVCDCSHDFDDTCSYRAPWVNEGAPKTGASAPLPEIREALPSGPKKL